MVVVLKKLIEEIYCFVGDKPLVLSCKEPTPWLALVSSQDVIVLSIQFNVIFLQVRVQLIRPKHFGDLHQLIIIIMSVEKRFFSKDLNDRVSYG